MLADAGGLAQNEDLDSAYWKEVFMEAGQGEKTSQTLLRRVRAGSERRCGLAGVRRLLRSQNQRLVPPPWLAGGGCRGCDAECAASSGGALEDVYLRPVEEFSELAAAGYRAAALGLLPGSQAATVCRHGGRYVLTAIETVQARDELMEHLDQEFIEAMVSQACKIVAAASSRKPGKHSC